ncbi:MAG: aromatic amino acid ammonia-lyase [Vicingaceae bacterium]|nr:aromatic amino acid ammonia-lyase [Vicingaceae bacterium]
MQRLTIEQAQQIVFKGKDIELTQHTIETIKKSFVFLTSFSKDKIIYGINTGFGPMAQFRIEPEELNQLQYNLIRSHASGSGNVLSPTYVRSVILARLNAFLQGNSGISPEVVSQLHLFLKHNIIPEIFEHGSVGASGDLVQLSHLALALIGEGYVYENNERVKTSEVLKKHKIEPLKLNLRDGLGIINGTSCMTGIAVVNLTYAKRLLTHAITASSIINEIIESFDDSFSKELNAVKLHPGQNYIAKEMREFLKDSKLIRKREELFKDDAELQRREFKKKIQEYYSIRCVPQILGPIIDTLNYAENVVENELNSTNDNPIINLDVQNVFHGGNFHGDYISLEMDKVKISLTKLSMLMERQLNFLLNHRLNDKFPPFLNAGKLGLNFGFQGIQYTATSTTAESQALSNSMYVHSIPNNNDNQDLVSMGTNSALMARQVLENTYQVMAIHLMAICQAIDLLSEDEKLGLSSKTKKVYAKIRKIATFITDDISQAEAIHHVTKFIKENSLV